MITLDDEMASLNGNLSLLDMSQQSLQVLDSPEIQKAMRQAQKVLEGLKIGSDPI
jgi:hypothetical protein